MTVCKNGFCQLKKHLTLPHVLVRLNAINKESGANPEQTRYYVRRPAKTIYNFVVFGLYYNKTDKDPQTGAMQNKVYGMASKHSHSINFFARYNKSRNHLTLRDNISHTRNNSM